MRKTKQLAVIAIACGLLGFACTSVAMAAGDLAPPADDPAGLLRAAYDAATTKRWSVLAGVVMIGVAYVVRRYVLGRVAWFQSRIGGFVLAVGLSLLGTFGLALGSGAPVSLSLAMDALGTAMAAAGGWAWIQNALEKKPAAGQVAS